MSASAPNERGADRVVSCGAAATAKAECQAAVVVELGERAKAKKREVAFGLQHNIQRDIGSNNQHEQRNVGVRLCCASLSLSSTGR